MKNIGDSIKNFKFVVKLMWQVSPFYILNKLLKVVSGTASNFIFIIFPKYIIDSIIAQNEYSVTLTYVFAMCACQFVVFSINTYTDTYIEKHSGIIQYNLIRLNGQKIMELDYEDLENPDMLNLSEKSRTGFGLYGFFDMLVTIGVNIISFIGYAAILLTYNKLLLLLVLGVVCVNLFCSKRKNKYYYQMREDAAPMNRKFSYLANLMMGFDYAKEIKVNNLGPYVAKKYDNNVSDFKKLLSKLCNKLFIYTGLSSFVSLIQIFALYAVVGYSAAMGSISIGDYSMYISAISAASGALIAIVTAAVDIGQNMKYATDMRTFFTLKRKVFDGGESPDRDPQNTEIVFDHVSFKYPRADSFTLTDINFKVKGGERISLVGVNGSGKTTIIKLLLRLYEPTEGRILVNGKDIKTYDYTEYLDLFAPVLQDFKIFAFTCQDNVVLNRPLDEEKMYRALYESGLGEKVKKLPKGVLTPLFKQFEEDGVEFSGGENQKLAIARAIYKDSPIVLLDEPTANLDPLAEYDIYNKMFAMLNGKTCFFVSHRLGSSRVCDRIFVISNGRLLADGQHDELMKECSLYREMYNKQAQFYVCESEKVE